MSGFRIAGADHSRCYGDCWRLENRWHGVCVALLHRVPAMQQSHDVEYCVNRIVWGARSGASFVVFPNGDTPIADLDHDLRPITPVCPRQSWSRFYGPRRNCEIAIGNVAYAKLFLKWLPRIGLSIVNDHRL